MPDDRDHVRPEDRENPRPDHACAYLFGLSLVVTIMFYAFDAHLELRATSRGFTLVMIAVTAIAHLHYRVMNRLDNLHDAAVVRGHQLVVEVARARQAMQDTRSGVDDVLPRLDGLVSQLQRGEEAAYVEGYAKGATKSNGGPPNLRPISRDS